MCLCVHLPGGIGCDGQDRGQSRSCLSSLEIYNPDTDTWREGPSLPTSLLTLRTNASNTGVVGNKLYLCGYFKRASQCINSSFTFLTRLHFKSEPGLVKWHGCFSVSDIALLHVFFPWTVGRHEIITKEILELDPAENMWTVVEKRAAMHDSYDVCLVANLNPRALFTA